MAFWFIELRRIVIKKRNEKQKISLKNEGCHKKKKKRNKQKEKEKKENIRINDIH